MVSVVMMAAAASGPPAADTDAVAASTPRSSRCIGSRSPIRPVEQTATSLAGTDSRPARCSAVCLVSAYPSRPVQALAPPEFSTTARTVPPARTSWLHRTGAALTRLAVKTPAAAADGPSLITTATSGLPEVLIPAATPAARNPSGAVTLMRGRSRCYSDRGQARRLRQAEQEVGVLDRLAGGALAQVVDGDYDRRPPGTRIGGSLHEGAI